MNGDTARICGTILNELKRHMVRPDRTGVREEDAYLDQDLLAERLHRYYRITLRSEELTAPLTILKDAGYTEYRRVAFGPPERLRYTTVWRITGKGLLLLQGDIQDETVKVLFW
jgi:hypothetical protein